MNTMNGASIATTNGNGIEHADLTKVEFMILNGQADIAKEILLQNTYLIAPLSELDFCRMISLNPYFHKDGQRSVNNKWIINYTESTVSLKRIKLEYGMDTQTYDGEIHFKIGTTEAFLTDYHELEENRKLLIEMCL